MKARASRWDLADNQDGLGQDGFEQGVRSFDATALLNRHPNWTLEWAEEVVTWFVDVGFASTLSGNGKVCATEAGDHLSRALSLCSEFTA